MAGGINKVILVGNLGRDPEMRYTPDGAAVANFSIATSESWNDRNTGEKREKTEWHRIVVFRRLAEICGEYLSKGRQVYIEGKLQTREWEDKDGNRRFTTEIVASQMQMLGTRDDFANAGDSPYGGQRSPGPGQARPAAAPAQPVSDDGGYRPDNTDAPLGGPAGDGPEDDIPF